ncbi:MAG: beta-L-arabinofuranosidase domain-containing protein [Candidatus Binatia bacterium]
MTLWRFAGALVALILGASVAEAAPAPFTPIAVTVREPDAVARRHWPLTFSVPFARGQLAAATSVQVVDEQGRPLPTQARPLAQWRDGSVRWLLVDTQVDLNRGQERRLRVQAGPTLAPSAPLKTTVGAEAVEVDTGVVRFSIPRHRFAIVEGLRPSGTEQPLAGPLATSLVAGERTGNAQPPTSVTVTESGPLRARVELRGTFGINFDYVVRIEVYAGQPTVRVWHTFINRHPTPSIAVPRVSLDWPLGELTPATYRFGIAGERPRSGPLGDTGVALLQADNVAYTVSGARADGHLDGWVELRNGRASVGLASRWFWQEYPQSLVARRDRLTYNLWAPEAEPAKAGIGVAKTHELALWVAPPDGLPAGLPGVMAESLIGVVDPTWVASSGALPQAVATLAPADRFVRKARIAADRYLHRNATERWNDCGRVDCTAAGIDRPRVGAYGMWNWGDWNFRGYDDRTKGSDSWGNLEYDTAQVLALTYAASGDAEVYTAMEAAARHFIDVDTIHAYPDRPEWVGMNHPKNPLHFSFELGGPDLGHTWVEGSLSYYYLTGDTRALDAARALADYLVTRAQSHVRGNPRQWGWPQVALVAVYDATGEPRYLDAAQRYAHGGMRAHPPGSSAHWKLGILADALAYTHAATGDTAIRQWLEQYAAGVMQRKAREDARAFPAVAYMAHLTGDPAMRAAALARADKLDLGSWGKPFTINGRIGFRIYSLLGGTPPAPSKKP